MDFFFLLMKVMANVRQGMIIQCECSGTALCIRTHCEMMLIRYFFLMLVTGISYSVVDLCRWQSIDIKSWVSGVG
jgi:hypothetical protein